MMTSTNLTSSNVAIDADLAEQAHLGHGVPSQESDPAAQFPLQAKEAKREANSALVGCSLVAGAASGTITFRTGKPLRQPKVLTIYLMVLIP